MSNKKQRTLPWVLSACLTAGLAVGLTPVAQAAAKATQTKRSTTFTSQRLQGTSLTVQANETLTISSSLYLSQLTLGSGASVAAPTGYSVTLTVDGVGVAQEARTYRGNIVLTVTEDIDVSYEASDGDTLDHVLRTGVYVNDGAVVAGKSVSAIVQGGTVTNTQADNITIRSLEEKFNGVIVEGASTYTVNRPLIQLTGNGGDDFVGYGAAIRAAGTSSLTVNNANIITKGAIRTAAFAGDSATLTVRNSSLSAYGGTLPDDYEWTVSTGKMMEVPWMLGITGNNRATNLVGSATANYIHSNIKSQAWGALSIDDTTDVALNATQCYVEVVESGYGSYSIGAALNTFTATTFKVPDMALIMANGEASATFQGGSVVKSGRFGVMMHGNDGGVLTIKDSSFDTQAAVIQAKSSNPTIDIDNASLKSANGLLIQAVVNDDPYSVYTGATLSGSNVTAVLSNSTLSGDIVNGNTTTGAVAVTLSNTQLTGAITEASTTHATASDGTELTFDHPELYKLVGEFVHTYASTGYGMTVSLAGRSTWTVNKTSYLTSLTIGSNSAVKAPGGRKLTMTVDGTATAITPGKSYSGVIVISVA
jgi:hypothetical protein